MHFNSSVYLKFKKYICVVALPTKLIKQSSFKSTLGGLAGGAEGGWGSSSSSSSGSEELLEDSSDSELEEESSDDLAGEQCEDVTFLSKACPFNKEPAPGNVPERFLLTSWKY